MMDPTLSNKYTIIAIGNMLNHFASRKHVISGLASSVKRPSGCNVHVNKVELAVIIKLKQNDKNVQ